MVIQFDPKKQSFPVVRKNLDCGFDPNNVQSGREPCQMGWYEFVCKKYCIGKSVLDVGAGMCEGLKLMRKIGALDVWGHEIDERLHNLDNQLIIGDLSNLKDIWECVTCFDVIEHVIDDLDFFNNLINVSNGYLFITTPNWSRSKAQNHCHCREYTIPQFVNSFSPDELWVASPDGKIHHKMLLKKENNIYVDMTRENTIYDKKIPEDLSFSHSTVDGNEWPHMLGVFKTSKTIV